MANIGLKTFILKKEDINRKWYLIDAAGKVLGRLAAEVAKILRGKNKPVFTPHVDCGDFVVIINAGKVKIKGNNKLEDKKYYRHSGYVGNLREKSLGKMLEKNPEFVIINAVKGMIPHNVLGRKILRKLKVYSGEEHPHKAQNPEKIEL
jgi:large subunit ribosomal protein L13